MTKLLLLKFVVVVGVDFGYQDCTPEYVKKFLKNGLKKVANGLIRMKNLLIGH